MPDDSDRRALGSLALWAIAGIAVVAAALGALIILQFQRVTQARAWVSHTDAVLLTTAHLGLALRDAERGQRDYLATGRSTYLVPYRAKLAEVQRLRAQLADLTRDNGSQQERLRSVGESIDDKLTELSRGIARREHQSDDVTIQPLPSDQGSTPTSAIDSQLQQVTEAEQRLLDQRLKIAQHQQNLADALVAVGTLVLVALLAMAARLTARAQSAMESQAHRLNVLVEDLQAQAQRKDDFLATLAHELRNPLAPIQSSADMLRHDVLSAAAITHAAAIIRRQVRHMSRLLDDLLTVTRLAHGKLQLRLSEVSALECIEAAIEMIKPFMDRKRQHLEATLPPQGLRLIADGARLTQVVANLLANASKFSDEECRIKLTAEATGADLVVKIVDHGIGIPREALPRLFDRFYQVGASGGRDRAGLGIGLALSKQLIDLHGGSISVTSAGANMGTTAVVRIPLIAIS
jgi:signal transduction histidine kinase